MILYHNISYVCIVYVMDTILLQYSTGCTTASRGRGRSGRLNGELPVFWMTSPLKDEIPIESNP